MLLRLPEDSREKLPTLARATSSTKLLPEGRPINCKFRISGPSLMTRRACRAKVAAAAFST